jgi:hypothetical protein
VIPENKIHLNSMLWKKYPKSLDSTTLELAYQSLQGDAPSEIPKVVWLLENPASPFALPGNIDLFGHDCIHLLLKQGFASANEAYVVGFTMGNDLRTTSIHFNFFKFACLFLYPPKYRLTFAEIAILEKGFKKGRSIPTKNLNQLDLEQWNDKTLRELRKEIELEITGDLSGMLSSELSGMLSSKLSSKTSSELSSEMRSELAHILSQLK